MFSSLLCVMLSGCAKLVEESIASEEGKSLMGPSYEDVLTADEASFSPDDVPEMTADRTGSFAENDNSVVENLESMLPSALEPSVPEDELPSNDDEETSNEGEEPIEIVVVPGDDDETPEEEGIPIVSSVPSVCLLDWRNDNSADSCVTPSQSDWGKCADQLDCWQQEDCNASDACTTDANNGACHVNKTGATSQQAQMLASVVFASMCN